MITLEREDSKTLVELNRIRPTPRILDFIFDKAKNIYRRYPRLKGVRICVKKEPTGRKTNTYIAQARLVLQGYDPIIEKRSEDLFAAIAQTLRVADRQLRRRARQFKAKQHRGLALVGRV